MQLLIDTKINLNMRDKVYIILIIFAWFKSFSSIGGAYLRMIDNAMSYQFFRWFFFVNELFVSPVEGEGCYHTDMHTHRQTHTHTHTHTYTHTHTPKSNNDRNIFCFQHNRTALHMACLVHHLDIADQLLRNGIDVFLKDKSGKICYFIAGYC